MTSRTTSRLVAQCVAWLVVFCVLTVGGLASAQSISHESQHAHHQKATHSTALCSWMCAAGSVLDSVSAPALAEHSPVALVEEFVPQTVPSTAVQVVTSRGPPVHAVV
ncbi:MAG: conserved protein of unknown function [Nitrospira sp.]